MPMENPWAAGAIFRRKTSWPGLPAGFTITLPARKAGQKNSMGRPPKALAKLDAEDQERENLIVQLAVDAEDELATFNPDPKALEVKKIEALKHFGHFLNRPGMGNILLSKGFQNLGQIEASQKFCLELAGKKTTPAKVKLQAIAEMSRLARCYADMIQEIKKLGDSMNVLNADRATEVTAPDLGMLNLTINNMPQASAPAVPAVDIHGAKVEPAPGEPAL